MLNVLKYHKKPVVVEAVEQISAHERITKAEVAYIKATERFVVEGGYETFQHDTIEWLKDMPLLPLHEGIVRSAFAVATAMQRRHEVEMHASAVSD